MVGIFILMAIGLVIFFILASQSETGGTNHSHWESERASMMDEDHFSGIDNMDSTDSSSLLSSNIMDDDLSSSTSSSDLSTTRINPASGLPMVGDIDVAGNHYGTNSMTDHSCSLFDDSFDHSCNSLDDTFNDSFSSFDDDW